MALITPEEYVAGIKKMKPRVFMNGKRVESILENKNTRTVVEANKASYAWALDAKYKDIMTVHSPLIGEVVNRYTYLSSSNDDLVKKAQAGTFTSEMLGTCTYRCVGYDAFHSLASTTWEMDRVLGTKYHPRFLEFLKTVQKKDLSVAGALTEPRGRRNQKTLEWPDPHLSLKIVDKKKEGIVVRGAKINISGAYAAHELVVLPQSAPLERKRIMPLLSPFRRIPGELLSWPSIPPTPRKETWRKISRNWGTRSSARGKLRW